MSDSTEIHDLSAQLGYQALSDLTAASSLEFILQSDQHQLLICERDKQVIGWLHILISHRIASALFAEIGGLAVNPAQRRLGVGKCLVEAARQWALNRGLPLRVRCNATRGGALDFYQACGFTDLKTQRVLGAPA